MRKYRHKGKRIYIAVVYKAEPLDDYVIVKIRLYGGSCTHKKFQRDEWLQIYKRGWYYREQALS